jgi:hypothetical protein
VSSKDKRIRGRIPKENANSCGELEISRAREVSLKEFKGCKGKDIRNRKIAHLQQSVGQYRRREEKEKGGKEGRARDQ